jgi:hypothetical protein
MAAASGLHSINAETFYGVYTVLVSIQSDPPVCGGVPCQGVCFNEKRIIDLFVLVLFASPREQALKSLGNFVKQATMKFTGWVRFGLG